MSECLASTVTAAPSAAGPGASAAATASRSASRSCTTQCCGPGSSGASQRPIAPVPQPRSWITQRPVCRSCRPRCSTRSPARAAASAGSRRASHSRLTRTPSAAHRDAPARTPATTDAVVDHPGSDSRRSPAARRNRALSSASPSQARSAAPSAAGSSGATSSPGRIPSAPWPSASGSSADVGGDDRQAAGQRLGDDHAVGLGARRQHQQVRGGVAAVEIGSGPRSREGHAVAQPAVQHAAPETLHERRVAVQAAHADAVPGQVRRSPPAPRAARRGPCRRSPPRRRAARRRPRSRSARSAASTPGSATCTRSAGSAYSSSSRRRRPRAGRDDGRGGREDRAFAPPDRRRPSAPAVAQRHVHEHDQAQPARLRHQHLGGRRGDQSVEQHDGAVGDPLRRRRRGRRTPPRRVAASRRVRRARAPTSRARPSPRQTRRS